MDKVSSMSRIVALPSTIGGIIATANISPNATTHIQVIAAVIVLEALGFRRFRVDRGHRVLPDEWPADQQPDQRDEEQPQAAQRLQPSLQDVIGTR